MPSMDDYIKEWNDYTLTVNSDRGPLTVKWQDADTLAQWSNIQAGLYLQEKNTLQTFYEHFPKWYQMFWDARARQGLFELANDAVVLDIGSGLAVVDLLLASYLPNSKFYLLDKEGFEFYPGVYYDPNYPEYNSWKPVHDAIHSTGLDPNRFTFMSPADQFPEQVDCVTSYLSWCWHYPKEMYFDRVYDCLKPGGKLILDVRTLSGKDVVGEITEKMKSKPVAHWFDVKLPAHIDNMPSPEPGMPLGGRFMWTKQ